MKKDGTKEPIIFLSELGTRDNCHDNRTVFYDPYIMSLCRCRDDKKNVERQTMHFIDVLLSYCKINIFTFRELLRQL